MDNFNGGSSGRASPAIEMSSGVQHKQSSRPLNSSHPSPTNLANIPGAHQASALDIPSRSPSIHDHISQSAVLHPVPPQVEPMRHPVSPKSKHSTSSRLFQSSGISSDSQPFLSDQADSTAFFIPAPYRAHTGRQLRAILTASSVRWFITAGLCSAYIVSVQVYHTKGALTEAEKRMFNAITSGISIALGLNLASAFKDLTLNMRWPILSAKERNLVEMDLILQSESMSRLVKLAFVSRRPLIIFLTIAWLLLNIAAQIGIATLNLTYGFEVNSSAVLLSGRNVSIPNMEHFWPQGNNTDPSSQDEEFTAHSYGNLAYIYGLSNISSMPKAGDIFNNNNPMLWLDFNNSFAEFRFSESSPATLGQPFPQSVYTDRTLRVNYTCEAHQVLANGNGESNEIDIDGIGKFNITHVAPASTTYFIDNNNLCDGDSRCSVVQAYEASANNPWYYKCKIKVGQTTNDTKGHSTISDSMAYIAGSSIAQVGYSDDPDQAAQVYPQKSVWGVPLEGQADLMGQTITIFALGSIAGASLFNPEKFYSGPAPGSGFQLVIGHPKFFYLIIGLVCGFQLFFCVIVAILANRVIIGPHSPLDMALLLRPVSDSLEGISHGKENAEFRDAKKQTFVRYEKARNGRWIFNMLRNH